MTRHSGAVLAIQSVCLDKVLAPLGHEALRERYLWNQPIKTILGHAYAALVADADRQCH